MRFLLVEDDDSVIRVISDACLTSIPDAELVLAKSRDAAVGFLAKESFDLVLCDLRLPSSDGALDAEVAHGLAVYAGLRRDHRGTPVLLASGFGTLKVMNQLLAEQTSDDPLGTSDERQMVKFFEKSDLPSCIAELRAFAGSLGELDSLEIATGTQRLNLPPMHARALRIFARRHGGTVARVALLSGGLSGARVFGVEVRDATGVVRTRAVAKLGNLEAIADEQKRYRTQVLPRLTVGSFTPLIGVVSAGGGSSGGLFYTLADDYQSSLFDVVGSAPKIAAEVIGRLQANLSRWIEGAPTSLETVGSVRARFVKDAEMEQFGRRLNPRWAEAERRVMTVRRATQHGDLHGSNVLVRATYDPIIIDFASVTEGPSALDPVTLEMSLLFHPAGHAIRGSWPAAGLKWDDAEAYIRECPVSDFVRACRTWAQAAAAGDREILATAYGYALRQLRYRDTDHELATRIANEMIDALLR